MTAFREIEVDLDAIRANVSHLRDVAGTPDFMAVVKANAYGHGAVACSRAALDGGATWLGVADITEGLALRQAGITAPILAWLHAPRTDFVLALAAGISIGVSSLEQLDAVARATSHLDGSEPAGVHLKLDTGLSRNGIAPEDWEVVFDRARTLERAGVINVEGLFSHLSVTSDADDRAAGKVFDGGIELAQNQGLAPRLTHLAATAAAFALPELRYSMVRVGVGIYGLSPFDDRSAADLGLVPAMTMRTQVAAVRRVPAGTGVSYGYTYRAPRETTLALIPVGYADGIPRQASGRASVAIGGRIVPMAGRVAMDQFVVDVGDAPVSVGDDVVVFGDPSRGVPGAEDWADAAGTINYEIVSRVGARPTRSYTGGRP